MACFKTRCNALGSVWYTLIVVALQAYLIYLGVERYKLYTDIKWPAGGYPTMWLNVYAGLYAACLPCLFFLFAFGVFKSGNIAGDNERLADREERTLECKPSSRTGEKSGPCHFLKSLWQHAPPFPQQLHVIVALLQLLAQQLMIAQLYKRDFISHADFLNTEMDFLFQRSRQLATNLPMVDTKLQGFQITASELGGSPLAPNLLPILMHVRLFGIPLEFANLVFALLMYSITYPSVFWRVNKIFSLLFSFHLFIHSACIIFTYLAFSVLFRIQETNVDSKMFIGMGQHLQLFRQIKFLFHPYTILGLFVTQLVLLGFAPITLYWYGYNKYMLNVINCQSKNNVRGGSHAGQSEYSSYRNRSYRPATSKLCCDGYGSHIAAIFLLALIVLSKSLGIYALMNIFQHEDRPFLLTCIIIKVAYLFSWIILWIGLTLRREWNFNVLHRAHELYALQKGLTTGHVRVNANPSQLKNALIVVHRDHMFVTDDQTAKQSLLRSIQQNQFQEVKDDGGPYWLKSNGGASSTVVAGSPAMRRGVHGDAMRTAEIDRLISGGGGGTLRRPSGEDAVMYHSVNRPMLSGMQQASQLTTPGYRSGSSPPTNDGTSYGTLQRGQSSGAYGALHRHPSGGVTQSSTLQRSMHASGQWTGGPTESYASIHKAKDPSGGIYGRRGSQDDGTSGYSSAQAAYAGVGQYATYARLPPTQSRLAGQAGAPSTSTLRMSSGGYASQQQIGIRRPTETPVVSVQNIRQSPLIGERSVSQDRNSATRDPSPYAARTTASGVKLSSFNQADSKTSLGGASGSYGMVGAGLYGASSQRAPVGQPQQLLWNGSQSTKTQSTVPTTSSGPLSNSSSAQDAAGCFTPNSTLTSQGSTYSRTPTRGSPSHAVPITTFPRNGVTDLDAEYNEGDTTLQRAPAKPAIVTGSNTVRCAVKVIGNGSNASGRGDDSANFSLGSSNGSGATANDYATSVV